MNVIPYEGCVLYIGKLQQRESLTNLTNLAQIVKLKQFNIKVFNISASIKLLSPLQCVQKINTFLI